MLRVAVDAAATIVHVWQFSGSFLLLQLGQNRGLPLRERRHFLQYGGLCRETGSQLASVLAHGRCPHVGGSYKGDDSLRGLTHQDVGAGDAAEPQVLDGSLLKLHVGVAKLAVRAQDVLDGGFHFWKQVDELDVRRQQQRPSRHRAQVELGVEEIELDQRAEEEETESR